MANTYCEECVNGNPHSRLSCVRGLGIAAPLPPTAEQTSIARFNALANEIRANQAESLKFYGSFMNVFDVLIHKIDRLAKPNVAVAKKKAAPLVGKKGTGRKG